jgi:hypothetical protein
MKKSLILLLALLTTGILVMAAVNVTGTWDMVTQGRNGEQHQDITLKQDGEKLAVSMMMPGRGGAEPTEVKGEGTVKGNALEFKITRTTQRGEFTTIYKGTVVDDTHMKGTREMSMGGQPPAGGGQAPAATEWTATKK